MTRGRVVRAADAAARARGAQVPPRLPGSTRVCSAGALASAAMCHPRGVAARLPPPRRRGESHPAPPAPLPAARSAAAPGEPAFVKVGDRVNKGQVVGIIEAMKLMNEIEVRRLAGRAPAAAAAAGAPPRAGGAWRSRSAAAYLSTSWPGQLLRTCVHSRAAQEGSSTLPLPPPAAAHHACPPVCGAV